jgi:hypothetical protein
MILTVPTSSANFWIPSSVLLVLTMLSALVMLQALGLPLYDEMEGLKCRGYL